MQIRYFPFVCFTFKRLQEDNDGNKKDDDNDDDNEDDELTHQTYLLYKILIRSNDEVTDLTQQTHQRSRRF